MIMDKATKEHVETLVAMPFGWELAIYFLQTKSQSYSPTRSRISLNFACAFRRSS